MVNKGLRKASFRSQLALRLSWVRLNPSPLSLKNEAMTARPSLGAHPRTGGMPAQLSFLRVPFVVTGQRLLRAGWRLTATEFGGHRRRARYRTQERVALL
jgi:hypothetical protein